MIHLLDIEIKDFMSIEYLKMDFSANETKLISGDNGAGKSALFNAIALVWIEYRKGDSYKDFIRTGCKTAHITHNALFNGDPLHMDVTLSNDKYANPLQRKLEYLGRTYINSEIKSFFKTFDMEHLEHVMFLFQGDNNIVDLKAGERAKLLKRLFHFEFESQVIDAKSRLSEEQQQLHDNNLRLEEMSKRTFTEQLLLPVSSEAEKTETFNRLKELEAKIAGMGNYDASKITSLREELGLTKAHIAEYKDDIVSLEATIAQLVLQIRDIKREEAPEEPVATTTLVASLEVQRSETAAKLADSQYELRTEQSRLKELSSQLVISKAGKCHACGNNISAENVSRLEAELDKLKSTILATKERIATEQEDVQSISEQLGELRQQIDAYNASRDAFKKAQDTLPQLEELSKAHQARLKSTRSSLKSCEKRLEELEIEIEAGRVVEESIAKKAELESQAASLLEWLEDRAKTVAINEERAKLNAQLSLDKIAHSARIQELATSISTSTISIEALKRVVSIFESEFPNFIIVQACGRIQDYINEIVQRIFPYMKVQLKPNRGGVEFYYTADYLTDQWLSVKMASGAQSAILSLAWRVAIARLYGVTTILLDEIDADCTDDNARLLYEFIASLDMFHQIMLISHRKEALRAVASLADNVTCYWVAEGGVYSEVSDPESI